MSYLHAHQKIETLCYFNHYAQLFAADDSFYLVVITAQIFINEIKSMLSFAMMRKNRKLALILVYLLYGEL